METVACNLHAFKFRAKRMGAALTWQKSLVDNSSPPRLRSALKGGGYESQRASEPPPAPSLTKKGN
jgi:hypothetical protein